MKQLILTLLFLCSLGSYTTAQLAFSGSDWTIGSLNLDDCSYQLHGLPDPFTSPKRYPDVALTPDGRLLAISGLLSSENNINETYLIEINPLDVLDSDTLFILEGSQKSALTCGPDYTLYIGGRGIHTYNLITEELSYIGSNPNARHVGDLAWHEGELYGSTIIGSFIVNEEYPPFFIRYNGLEDSTIQYNSTLITDGFPWLIGLSSVYDYDNERFRLIGNSAITSTLSNQKDTSILHEIFLEDTTFTTLCEVVLEPANRYIMGLTSSDEFRTNFQLQLDLDADDSSGRFIDHHQTNGLCTRSFPLSDQDVHIRAPLIGVDSLIVELAIAVHPTGEETIGVEELPGFQLITNNTSRLKIIPIDPTDIAALEALITQLQLHIAGDELQTGERRVDFRLYSDGQPSDMAMAYVYPQPDIIPYPGEDYEQGVCPIDLANLFTGLGEDVYPDGYWSPELRDGGNFYQTGFTEPGIYHYIVQEGSCGPDTASVTITEFPHLLYNYGGTATDLQVIYLCPEDTVNWQFDPTVLLDWEWTVAPYYDTEITITEPDIYGLVAIDTNGCDYYLRTAFREPEWEESGPGMLVDTMVRCEGKTLYFYNNPVSSDTTICNITPSTSDCDLTHCRTFQFIPGIETLETAAICDGETYNWLGQSYTTTGFYQQILDGTDLNCDTIASLDLNINPIYERNLIANLVPGGSFTVGDSILTEPGFYSILLQSSQGCDSLINLELETVNNLLDPLFTNCTIPNLLRKGQNDWQLSCSADFNIRHWILYDAQGQAVSTRHTQNTNSRLLLPRQEQLSLSAGIYFYRIEYEWEGGINYSTGKIVFIE